jgi:capsular exopolysaccharide synthesis family protein
MAQAGNKVILVDADFRRPALHRLFGDRENVGLGNLILQDLPESACIQPTEIANLRLVCAGQTPPNPSELLGSARMAKVLQRLTVTADIVILDTPPLSAVTDAAVLGALVQGAVLVVERGGARVPDIMKSIETLQAVGSDIRGVVLNRAHSDEVTAYYYYGTEPGQEQERPQRPSAKSERLPGTVPGTASGE